MQSPNPMQHRSPMPVSRAHLEIAKKVRTGEYFREARTMYDVLLHDLMAERYFYVFITGMALLSLAIAFFAVQSLYPLRTPVPFIVSTSDSVEDLPRIRTVIGIRGENPSDALARFLVQNYITFREEYDISSFDRNVS